MGYHSQQADLSLQDQACYRFVFNGLTQSERTKIEKVSYEPQNQNIQWSFIGHSTQERMNLITRLSDAFSKSGFVYMTNKPQPIREGGPHIDHQQFQIIQQHCHYVIWCSHHPYLYLESERFREAALAGTLPVKVINDSVQEYQTIPFSYLLVSQSSLEKQLGLLNHDYERYWTQFRKDLLGFPALENEFGNLIGQLDT